MSEKRSDEYYILSAIHCGLKLRNYSSSQTKILLELKVRLKRKKDGSEKWKKCIQNDFKLAGSHKEEEINKNVQLLLTSFNRNKKKEDELRKLAEECTSALTTRLEGKIELPIRVAVVKERIKIQINGESIEQTDFTVLDSANATKEKKSLPLYSQFYYRSLAFEDSAIDPEKSEKILRRIRQYASVLHQTSTFSFPQSSSSSPTSSSSDSSSSDSPATSSTSTPSFPIDLSFVFVGGYPEFLSELCKLSASLPSALGTKSRAYDVVVQS